MNDDYDDYWMDFSDDTWSACVVYLSKEFSRSSSGLHVWEKNLMTEFIFRRRRQW